MGEIVKAHGYELDAEERYVINIERELSEQSAIMAAIQSVGLPTLNDYHQWLKLLKFRYREHCVLIYF